VRACEGPQKGLVIDHADEVVLRDCRFVVSEAGRQRAIRERRRNVHAYVVGERIIENVDEQIRNWSLVGKITYNPFRWSAFQLLPHPDSRVPVAYGNLDYLTGVIFAHHPDTICTGWCAT
jgi:acetaldehyde dehydrogenase (acetylating)